MPIPLSEMKARLSPESREAVAQEVARLRAEIRERREDSDDLAACVVAYQQEIARLRERLTLAEAVCQAVWDHEQADDALLSGARIGAAVQAWHNAKD
jgi:predicted  nucleic acid-binding Zn-ribbon protein